jgi:hypothetical protein
LHGLEFLEAVGELDGRCGVRTDVEDAGGVGVDGPDEVDDLGDGAVDDEGDRTVEVAVDVGPDSPVAD